MRNLLFLLLFCATKSIAQPIFAIKTSPIYALNPFQQTAFFAVDLPIARRFGLEIGFGKVFNSTNLAQFKGESYEGFKFKPSLKYFFEKEKPRNGYVCLTAKYSQIQHEYYLNVARQGFQYTEKMLLNRRLEVRGLGIGFGENIYFGKKNQWLFEPFFAFGIRQKRIYFLDLPPDGELIIPRGIVRTQGTFIGPDLMINFNFGYILLGREQRTKSNFGTKINDFLMKRPTS
jgi:hypothetical protein